MEREEGGVRETGRQGEREKERERTRTRKTLFYKDCSLG